MREVYGIDADVIDIALATARRGASCVPRSGATSAAAA
jgi:hypothetical protein